MRGLVEMPLAEVDRILRERIEFRYDPWSGLGDYIAHPAITWQRGFGDCDDVVEIWGQLLTRRGYRAYRLTVLTLPFKSSHVLCLFYDFGVWRLVDNGGLYSQRFETKEEAVRYLRDRDDERVIDFFLERFGG